jgi:predicted nicotinamide N-methyase
MVPGNSSNALHRLTSVFSSSRNSHSSRDSFEDDTHAPLLRLEPENSDMKAGEADDSTSETSYGTTELIHEKPPWWSYFWVAFSPICSTNPFDSLTGF